MLVLFWLSYNLFREEEVARGSLIAIGLAAIVIVLLQLAGLAGETERGRATVFDANPNGVAAVLSVGFLAVFGLAYGRKSTEWKTRLLFWATSVGLATAIVRTGSRGAALALALSFGVLLFNKGDIGKKLKLCFLGFIVMIVLAVTSYQIPAVRDRWARTITAGEVAGRDEIYAAALEMVFEKPVAGWGPINHSYELGSRLGRPSRDPHNAYLFILTEVGMIGFIPFFLGLLICWRAAWMSRFNIHGITPLMMMSFVLMINMKGSWQNRKLFWLVLAYVAASSTYDALRARLPNITLKAPFQTTNKTQSSTGSRKID
jgi:O-antigen ligase